mgnify:CR=1 FL=1|jgi:hypothetical protein
MNNYEDSETEKIEEYKIQLDKLLDGTELASKHDPNFFYNLIQDYKTESNTLLNDFYSKLENKKKFQYGTTINDSSFNSNINYNCTDIYDSNTCINDILKDIPYNDKNKIKILKLKYNILQNNIEILRTYIRAEREGLVDTINDMRNSEQFATTLNSDYSEIYKYKYLRNWGIFLSILGGAFFFKKMT